MFTYHFNSGNLQEWSEWEKKELVPSFDGCALVNFSFIDIYAGVN